MVSEAPDYATFVLKAEEAVKFSVFSPRIASIATRALNFGLYCFRVVVIDPPSLNDPAES